MNMQAKSAQSVTLNIGGMSCSGCASTVQEALNNIDGVTSAKVNLENESVSVIYKPDAVSTDDFKRAVEDAGYEIQFKANDNTKR